jgi:hypothetical protein
MYEKGNCNLAFENNKGSYFQFAGDSKNREAQQLSRSNYNLYVLSEYPVGAEFAVVAAWFGGFVLNNKQISFLNLEFHI